LLVIDRMGHALPISMWPQIIDAIVTHAGEHQPAGGSAIKHAGSGFAARRGVVRHRGVRLCSPQIAQATRLSGDFLAPSCRGHDAESDPTQARSN
jgi:hypothetical protein